MVKTIREYEKALAEVADLEALLADKSTDRDMRELAEAELPEMSERIEQLEKDMQILLLPKDAADEKSAIVEIRAGTGGSEAALFAGNLFRMYERFASTKGWKVEVLSASEGEAGGFKEIIATLPTRRFLQAEVRIRVHRVQRVPNRSERTHPHLCGNGCGSARG